MAAHRATAVNTATVAEPTLRTRAGLHRSADVYDEVLLVVGERTRAALADTAVSVPGEALSWGETAALYQGLGSAYEAFRRHLAARHQATGGYT